MAEETKPRRVSEIVDERAKKLSGLKLAELSVRDEGTPQQLYEGADAAKGPSLSVKDEGKPEDLAPAYTRAPNLTRAIYANPHDKWTYEDLGDGRWKVSHPERGDFILDPNGDHRAKLALANIEHQVKTGVLKVGALPFGQEMPDTPPARPEGWQPSLQGGQTEAIGQGAVKPVARTR